MHLGNGAITPECAALTYGAAAAGLAASTAALRRSGVSTEKLQLAVTLGCGVFAAQAINVPLGLGFSGHFVGGVLLAWYLGPALAAWTMAAVLVVQALLLGDGGIAALGANVLNMALVPAALVAIVNRFDFMHAPTARRALLGGIAAIAVMLASLLVVGETALFRPAEELVSWARFGTQMLAYHGYIGVLEGFATSLIVAVVPLLQRRWTLSRGSCLSAAAAAAIAVSAVQVGSSLPDGYEAAAQMSGVEWLLDR